TNFPQTLSMPRIGLPGLKYKLAQLRKLNKVPLIIPSHITGEKHIRGLITEYFRANRFDDNEIEVILHWYRENQIRFEDTVVNRHFSRKSPSLRPETAVEDLRKAKDSEDPNAVLID